MTEATERFQRLSSLFDEVVELAPADREARIQEGCAGDAELEAELRDLLAADLSAESQDLVGDVISSEAAALQQREMDGVRLGAWQVVEPIGEGGMGTVYLAERADGAYEAQAAVKLVRGGIPSPLLDERFKSERQILAGLRHPGVAQLLDGGSTDDGTPYLVMEYIDGAPITTWCEEAALGIDDRLRLFLKVCEAVAYAHRQLVAHRDLKPSNILVTRDGDPKLLDFGIAKLIDTMSESGEVTQTYTVMTPAYASPEQVSGERASASADVYSLGVLLYEMLSGRLPLETKGLTPVQLISRVTQDVPAVVSSVVPDDEQRKRLSGDLDAIVSRALRKEPDGRYVSVEALAEDVRLHLSGLPIRTRSDDWRYRAGKLVRKNRGVVSGSLLMLLLGISFTVNTVLQSRAVARERDRAEAERVTAQRVSAFLEGLFSEADPNTATSRDVTVRDVLDRGAERVLTELDEEPATRAALAHVIGRVYSAIGEYDAAEPLLDSALVERRRQPTATARQVSDAFLERGALAYNVGEYESAVGYFESAIAELEGANDSDLHAVGDAIGWLAVTLAEMGELEEAESRMRGAVQMHRDAEVGSSVELAVALKSLQDILRTSGKVDESVEVGTEALAMNREVFGNDHLETAHALNQMGSSLNAAGRAAEAVPLVEEGLAIRQAAYDGPHVEIAASLGNLANMIAASGRDAEAIAPRRASVAMLEELFGESHPYVAGSTAGLGSVLLRADSLEAAEPVLIRAVRYHEALFPEGHPNRAPALTSLGTLYRRTQRYAESVETLEAAYAIRTGALPEGHWHIAATGLELGRTHDARGDDAEAERYLMEAFTILGDNFGAEDPRTGQARDALRAHYERRGLDEAAAALGPAG